MNYLQRKKRAFMSIVNSVKGFVRTIIGIPPLTLPNCVDGDSLINYKIYGNSVQDGTPSSDNPIEVKSVGEYDEETEKYKIPVVARGKNLLDYKTFASRNQSSFPLTINDDGSLEYVGNHYIQASCSNLESGKTYSLNADIFIDGEVDERVSTWRFLYSDGSLSGGAYIGKSLTVDSEKQAVSIYVYGKPAGVDYELKMRNIQLEEGEATEYEPYHEPVTTNIYLDEPLAEGERRAYKENGLPMLPMFKGTTVYEIDTSIQPSNMEVTYYSTQKGD